MAGPRVWVVLCMMVGACPQPSVVAPPEGEGSVPEAAVEPAGAEAGAAGETAGATAAATAIERRPAPRDAQGREAFPGISYGPFREGHHPAGPYPSQAQILEDLKIVSERWSMIRMYGSRGGPAELTLKTIQDEKLPLRVMIGAWIAPEGGADGHKDHTDDNKAEVAEAIRLANAYPDVVAAVSIGNESQVSWSAHRTDTSALIGHLRTARAGVKQPVATADDYNFWNKPESHAVAAEVDFIVLHAYAMWNGKSLDEAIAWTDETVGAIRKEHEGIPVVVGETGWATELNPEGNEKNHIKAPAGEDEQARFYAEFVKWAEEEGIGTFYFEAFDEPWKGSDNPREVEKHWGLYNVDRTPKKALPAFDAAQAEGAAAGGGQ